jgi:hypothetical protein
MLLFVNSELKLNNPTPVIGVGFLPPGVVLA